jgi:DNA-binding NarL/FixJ family response regulator
MRAERKLLSERDRKIISLLAEGYNDASISEFMGMSEAKVCRHIRTMMQMQNFTYPYQLITWAYQDAIII